MTTCHVKQISQPKVKGGRRYFPERRALHDRYASLHSRFSIIDITDITPWWKVVGLKNLHI
jgi:hypothetical protein